MPKHWRFLIGSIFLFFTLARFPNLFGTRYAEGTVVHHGITTQNGRYVPVKEALVGWRGDGPRVTADFLGRFKIPESPITREVIATKPGYRIASASWLDMPRLRLQLEVLPEKDNERYQWISPHPDPARSGNCGNCHGEIYREWLGSAHAKSAANPKFLSIYDGFDDTPRHADQPKLEAWLGHEKWNVRREHPGGDAVCATCHLPTFQGYLLGGVRGATGVARSGVHCDYCHKVADVPPGKFGTRFGRDALQLLRPAPGDTLTFGPLDDAVRPANRSRSPRFTRRAVIARPAMRGSFSASMRTAPTANGSTARPRSKANSARIAT